MAIKVTGADKVISAIGGAADILRDEIIRQLAYLGEESVTRARQDHPGNWKDQTSNLRSSIGYAIYDHAREVLKSAFEQVGSGAEGSSKGKDYVQSLAAKYAQTYALVVVAGMSYAEFVELHRDVLAGAELAAKKVCDERIRKAVEVAVKRVNRMMQ